MIDEPCNLEKSLIIMRDKITFLEQQYEDLNNRMNLRTNSLRNDLDDMKEDIQNLVDET